MKKKKKSNVENLEKTLRKRGGKIKTIYEKCDDNELKDIIDNKIEYIWNYILKIDNKISDDKMLEEEMKHKIKKKISFKKIDNYDEIIYYNKNLENLINIQKIQKTLHHFNININIEDIINMILYFTNNKYFKENIEKNIYFEDYLDKKKTENKFSSIDINNLYINYDMFKYIFLNIDLNIASNGNIW
ncbi:hypothetical protein YYC_04678 [Plasmodium yoelii 17X]|uniref:Uncharacterized protein n=3 Tax=Plasmodium yoelii TaxID=5861 RepID=A0AAF0B2L3_PLAYO|nr:conserved Plasmodium protein, unknown function [Plasmodium yoelii]ETB57882.1 hypothetical protein YYC_04678 [Plasmodium yoelii 17X]WBY57523.1 hypothetical protein Py17XNL_000900395 [Plasmodium yoelii yoelii]CDU18154.1 conserved Plasmodium protein, unknown function [Plasmodium yoelii]VTZ78571.1 conserved Plasmodium protein, unknown function [Plasmodium yoelii]|eukprot:XP_022812261.1 conserved Plasmodium protein, unknown function [Plasmodium yoelii]